MCTIQKFKEGIKAIWKDNSGVSVSLEQVGYAIAIITLAGVVAGIGITATKHMAGDIATDIDNFSVDASSVNSTGATGDAFTIKDGSRAVDTVTIEN